MFKFSMRRGLTILGVVAALTAVDRPAYAALIGTAHYTFGCGSSPDGTVGACGSPDTGWLDILNTGTSTFSGTATLSGVAPGQTINISISGTLAPGQDWVFNAGPESSNVGGFNKVSGGPDNGLLFSMTGSLDGSPFSNSIYDKDIHSGVFRTNPYGVTLDNYILQGGDPFGRDTGDGYETTQASGMFVWAAAPTAVPEPASLILLGTGLVGVSRRALRRKNA